jgi:hypothetical protein
MDNLARWSSTGTRRRVIMMHGLCADDESDAYMLSKEPRS